MSTDSVQKALEAVVAIVDTDATMRTLCNGRTSGLAVPFESLDVLPALPVVVFQPASKKPHETIATSALTVEFSAFASTQTVANELVDRLEYLFYTCGVTPQAFAANGAPNTCQNPTAEPFRAWPGTQPDQDDPAPCRADITLSFLLPD